MKKRLVSLLLVLAMVLAMVPAVLAEVVDVEIIEHNPSGGIEYVEPIKKPETEKKEIFAEFMSADGKFYKGMWLEVKDGKVELPTAKELGWNLERGIFVEAWKLGKNTYWFNWKSGSFQKADADDASEACFIADFNKKPVEDIPDEVYVTFKWGNKKSDKFTKAFETDKDGYITLDSKLKKGTVLIYD